VPYALPAVCLDISSAEAQLGQVHATNVRTGKLEIPIHPTSRFINEEYPGKISLVFS
jgi:hypothetical protein